MKSKIEHSKSHKMQLIWVIIVLIGVIVFVDFYEMLSPISFLITPNSSYSVLFVSRSWSEQEDYKFQELKDLNFNVICLDAGYWTYNGKIEFRNWAKAELQSFALRAESYGLGVQAAITFMDSWAIKYDLSKIDVNEPVRIVREYPSIQGINNDLEKIVNGDEGRYIELNNQMATLVQAEGKIFTLDLPVGTPWYPLISNLKVDAAYYMMYGNHPMDETNFKYGMKMLLKNSGSPAVILMRVGDTPSLGVQLEWIDDVLEENLDLPKPVGCGVWHLEHLTGAEKQAWENWINKALAPTPLRLRHLHQRLHQPCHLPQAQQCQHRAVPLKTL